MQAQAKWTGAALTLLLAACSGIPQRASDQALQERYQQYAGAPIEHFTWLGRFDSWNAISDSQLVVWPNSTDAYLISVRAPCISLRFANRIGLSSTSGTVTNRLDSVLVDRDRCQITEIRPVDYKRMRADLRKERAPS